MEQLCERVFAGNIRAAARLMRLADDRATDCEKYMKDIWKRARNAHIIGITGAPGSGKSTLTDKLIGAYRAMGKTVGVVAIDPTSPFSGGAILGDRIRMAEHATDEGVFIRSVGTRGHLGGLSVSTMDIAAVMDAMGKDIVIIETVGVGQDEVEIATVADTCIVVTVPGMGDDIQAIKAGIFEIADIFIVNKADREGAERTAHDLETMLEITPQKTDWKVNVLRTVAARGEGIDIVVNTIETHRAAQNEKMRAERRTERLLHVAYGAVKERLIRDVFPKEKIYNLLKSGYDPYSAIEELWSRK